MDCNGDYDYDCCDANGCCTFDREEEVPATPPQAIVLPGVSAWAALYERRPALHALMLRAIRILLEKSHDYAGADCEPLANFRECERIDVPAWKGVLVRMGDKWRRLTNFARVGLLEVDDENFADTLLDLANYAFICAELCQEITEPEVACG